MKVDFAEQAIVLKVGVFREADCWVRLVSERKGLLTAFAFGGRRSRRRFCGCLDPFSLVHFRFTSNATGEYLYLNEGTLLERFTELRRNASRLGMAVNCLKFVEAVHQGTQESEAPYHLLLETLRVLDTAGEVPVILPLLFRAKLTFEQGYAPQLRRCVGCGASSDSLDRLVFALDQGKVYCLKCRPNTVTGMFLSGSAASSFHDILEGSPSQWVQNRAGVSISRECLKTLDRFVQFHMGLEWQGTNFQRI